MPEPLSLQHVEVADVRGQPCVSLEDAQRLAEALAADPAQSFHFPTDCGARTELMIGRLIAGGLPPALVHRAYIYAPNTPDMRDARLTRRQPPGASLRKLAQDATVVGPDRHEFRDVGIGLEFFHHDYVIIADLLHGQGRVHDLPELGSRTGFIFHQSGESHDVLQNHVTIALAVHDPSSGMVERMIIDPHLTDPIRPVSFAAWRDIQGCADAVMLCGAVGRAADIALEPGAISAWQIAQLHEVVCEAAPDACQADNGPPRAASLAAILASTDARTRDTVAARFLPYLGGHKVRDCCYATDADQARNDDCVANDWHSLDSAGVAVRCEEWIAYLRPLAWLDRRWKETFYDEPAPVELKPKATEFTMT